jgi:Arc/MetJ-type ribon-helix-helix transcriptional regulator
MVMHLTLNVNLGAPYEAKINKIIQKGYAASQTEVIRQAIMYYDKYLEQEEEEVRLANKGIAKDMEEIKSGKTKTVSHAELKKKLRM